MKRILIYHNKVKKSLYLKNQVMDLLKRGGYVFTRKEPDLIMVIGGDGTMLSAIKTLHHLNIPFVGINTGSLGFLPTVTPGDIKLLPSILKNPKMDAYPLLEMKGETVDGDIISCYAFNEVVVKQALAKMLEGHVFINGKPFNYFTGDGLIFSTAIGTTGYAIWAGGSAIHASLDVFEMTPINPNDNSVNRPFKHSIILPNDTVVDVKVLKARFKGINIACDGTLVSNTNIKKATIRMSDKYVHIMRTASSDYFALFRNKIIDKRVNRILEL